MKMDQQVLRKLNKARKELHQMIGKVERDESCVEVILQSKRIQKLLQEADGILLRCHLNESLNGFVKNNNSDTYLKEIMKGVKYL